MCDYSLKHLASRPAKVDDKLVVTRFASTVSVGFCDPSTNAKAVVCVLPGTELAFAEPITRSGGMFGFGEKSTEHCTAIFRQINKDQVHTHHDAMELPDGSTILLHDLKPGQTATVLQLPAAPQTEAEAKAQQRLEVVA